MILYPLDDNEWRSYRVHYWSMSTPPPTYKRLSNAIFTPYLTSIPEQFAVYGTAHVVRSEKGTFLFSWRELLTILFIVVVKLQLLSFDRDWS